MAFPDRGDAWYVEHFYSSVVRHVALVFLSSQRIHIDIFLLVNLTQFRLCSYLVNMGATACGGKADSISMLHSPPNMKVWGGALSHWNTKIN